MTMDWKAEAAHERRRAMSLGIEVVTVFERGDGWCALVLHNGRTATYTRARNEAEALSGAIDNALGLARFPLEVK